MPRSRSPHRAHAGAIRLSLVLGVAIAALVAMIVGVIGYTTNQEVTDIFDRSAHDSRALAIDNTARFANLLASNTAVTVAPAVLDHNYSYIRSVLADMTRLDDNLVYVGVSDNDSDVIEESGARTYDDTTMKTSAPITSRGRVVGQVVLEYSTRDVDERIRAAQAENRERRSDSLRNLLLGGGVVLGFGFAVAVGFGVWLSRPVRRMAAAASLLGEGKFEVRVDEGGPEELRQLANTFNSMASELGASVEASIERAALEREVATARRLQREMMPPEGRIVVGQLEISSWYQPAGKMGGDWWTVSEPGDDGRVTIIVGDVIGHGIPAALFTAAARSAYRTAGVVAAGRGPADVLSTIDSALRGFAENSTMSCCALQLDVAGGELEVALGAHPTPLWFRRRGDGVDMEVLDAHGPMLGDHDPGAGFTSTSRELAPGDLVAMVTDGILEATNDQERMFGLRRLGAVIAERADEGLTEILAAVRQTFEDHIGDDELADDVTVVLVRVLEPESA